MSFSANTGISKKKFKYIENICPLSENKMEISKVSMHLDTLTGKDYIDACMKLAEFITPKMQRTALAADEGLRLTGTQLVDVDGSSLAHS